MYSHRAYECLSPSQICDGVNDCLTGEDEHACGRLNFRRLSFFFEDRTQSFTDVIHCSRNSWLCPNGSCIKNSLLCDGNQDCLDGADEVQSTCDLVLCGPANLHCPTGQCIPIAKVRFLFKRHRRTTDLFFTAKKCNGARDCSDGFDEKDCPPAPLLKTVEVFTAKRFRSIDSDEFLCSTSQSSTRSISIPRQRVCDG